MHLIRLLHAFCVFLLCIMLCLPFTSAVAESEEHGLLRLHCFSFGKADAFLLTAEEGAVLIDCGLNGQGKEISAYLKENGFTKLEALIITHFDKDHVGGAAKVLKSVPVGTVYQSNCPKDSSEYEKYLKTLDQLGIVPVTVREETVFSLGEVHFTILPPLQERYLSDDSNNSSLVTVVQAGEKRLLFTGDCEGERLFELLNADLGHADLLQIPHHGKWQVQLPALLELTAPECALITDSEEESADYMTFYTLKQMDIPVCLTRTGPVDLIF